MILSYRTITKFSFLLFYSDGIYHAVMTMKSSVVCLFNIAVLLQNVTNAVGSRVPPHKPTPTHYCREFWGRAIPSFACGPYFDDLRRRTRCVWCLTY